MSDALVIKPAEGKLAVLFVDDDDEDDEDVGVAKVSSFGAAPADPSDAEEEGCLAIVQGVGDKVKAKKGQTVVVRPWARRDGLKIAGSPIRIIDSWNVMATLGD